MSGLVVALVPAFNEESYIASVLSRLFRQVDRVIVCDDGSVGLMGQRGDHVGDGCQTQPEYGRGAA